MKLLLVLLFCVNFGHAQEAGEGGDGGDGGDFVHPDQFLNVLVNGYFKCGAMCSSQPAFVGYQQAEFARMLNNQWIRHMEHKLNLWGFEIHAPPPIIVDVFDQERVGSRHGGDGKVKSGFADWSSKLNNELPYARPEPLDSMLIKHDHIGHVFGGGLRDTIDEMNQVLFVGEIQASHTKDWGIFEEIPKITTKQDMFDARAKAEDTESDVYFIFFHNEADHRNRHIKDYLKVKDKYSHMANFYRTDTGFALIWAELLEIHRIFDCIVAVHPQNAWKVRHDNPTIVEKATNLREIYELYDEFVHLQRGDFMNFASLHLGFDEEAQRSNSNWFNEFPHVAFETASGKVSN